MPVEYLPWATLYDGRKEIHLLLPCIQEMPIVFIRGNLSAKFGSSNYIGCGGSGYQRINLLTFRNLCIYDLFLIPHSSAFEFGGAMDFNSR